MYEEINYTNSTLYVEGEIQIARPWLPLHFAQTRDRRTLLSLVFLWDPNLGSRIWESLKGVVTGSNSFKLWIVKLCLSHHPIPSFHSCLHITLFKAAETTWVNAIWQHVSNAFVSADRSTRHSPRAFPEYP